MFYGIPKAIAKERRRLILAGVVLSVVGIGAGQIVAVVAPGLVTDGGAIVIDIFAFAGMIVVIILFGDAEKRVRKVVDDHDGCVCTICAYPLPKETSGGTCPECGHVYTLEDERTAWRDYGAEVKIGPLRRGDEPAEPQA